MKMKDKYAKIFFSDHFIYVLFMVKLSLHCLLSFVKEIDLFNAVVS